MGRLKRWFKVKVAIAIAAVVVAIGIIGGISYASNAQPFLGDCIEYGIVCNYLNQTADMETNFATGKYQSNGHSNGNTISEEKANASGKIRIGETADKPRFRGNPSVVINEDVKKYVKEMIASVSNYAESVVDKTDIATSEYVKDENNYIVDITDVKDNLVYVAANNMIDNLMNGKIQNGGLNIILRADQSIVLNTQKTNKITIPRYIVTIKDGEKTNEQMAESVIWNMPYVNNLELSSDHMRATLIAPKAFVNLNVTGEGWLVCDTIVSNSGEWHMISKKVKDVVPSATAEEMKTPKPTEIPDTTDVDKHTKTPTATQYTTIVENPVPTITPTINSSAIPKTIPSDTPETITTPIPSSATATPPLTTMNDKIPLAAKKLIDPKTPKESIRSIKSKKVKALLDDDVPLSDSAPETGDCFDVLTILLVMLASLIFIVLVIRINCK